MAESPEVEAEVIESPNIVCLCKFEDQEPGSDEHGNAWINTEYLGGLTAHEIGYGCAAMIADISREVGRLAEMYGEPEILEHFQKAVAENRMKLKGKRNLEGGDDAT